MKNENEHNKLVGIRVKAIREAKKITQRELLAILGSKSIDSEKANYISMIEHGKRGLSAKNIIKICDALDVLPEYLMLQSDYMTEKERREAEFWSIHKTNVTESSFFEMLASKAGYEVAKVDKWELSDFGAIRELSSCELKNETLCIEFTIGDVKELFSDIEDYALMRLRRIIEKKSKEGSENG